MDPIRKKQLLRSLSSRDGQWRGKTYREIAALLSEGWTEPISARSVRYAVMQAKKQGIDLTPRLRGNPSPSRAGRKPVAPEWYGAVLDELRALTGLPASQLYLMLKAGSSPLAAMSRASFYNIVGLKLGPVERSRAKRASILERFRVRIHAVCLERIPERHYWIILGAYEESTRYVKFHVLDVDVVQPDGLPERKRRGRPRAAIAESDLASSEAIVTVTRFDKHCTCTISPDLVDQFVDEIKRELHPVLPSAVKLNRAVHGDQTDAWRNQRAERYEFDIPTARPSASHHISEAIAIPVAQLIDVLTNAQNMHNKAVAFPALTAAQSEVTQTVMEARKPKYISAFGANKQSYSEKRRIKERYLGNRLVPRRLKGTTCVKVSVPGVFKKMHVSNSRAEASG